MKFKISNQENPEKIKITSLPPATYNRHWLWYPDVKHLMNIMASILGTTVASILLCRSRHIRKKIKDKEIVVSLSVDFISCTLYFILETCQTLSKQHYFSVIYIHQKILIGVEVTLTVSPEWQPAVTTSRALVTSLLSGQSLISLSSRLHFYASTHHFLLYWTLYNDSYFLIPWEEAQKY